MNETEFHAILVMAKNAGHKGKPMPDFGAMSITRVQMAVLNKAYEEARNAHHAANKSKRRP